MYVKCLLKMVNLELDKQTLVSSNYIDKVIELLPNKKSFKQIRQVIADSNVQDF